MTNKDKIKFMMPSLCLYEYCGEKHVWIGPTEEILIPYNTDTIKMYKKAHNAFAKIIVQYVRHFKESDWKYINNIDFHIVIDKVPEEKKRKIKTEIQYEYTDLFGVEKQITNKGERIKPIPKGE